MSTSIPFTSARRADHIRNQATLLSVARRVFAEQGPDASIEEIARRAGFAKGTFFRHFPSKESLIQALLADHLTGLGEIAQQINATSKPGWDTLCLMLERFLDRVANDRSLAEFMERSERIVPNEDISRAQRVLDTEVSRAVADAQARGEVRPDVSGADIKPIMFMIVRTTARHHASEPTLGRRYLRLFLDGIRAANTTDLGDPPLPWAGHPAHGDC